jgi:hypothetical protein
MRVVVTCIDLRESQYMSILARMNSFLMFVALIASIVVVLVVMSAVLYIVLRAVGVFR